MLADISVQLESIELPDGNGLTLEPSLDDQTLLMERGKLVESQLTVLLALAGRQSAGSATAIQIAKSGNTSAASAPRTDGDTNEADPSNRYSAECSARVRVERARSSFARNLRIGFQIGGRSSECHG